MGIAWLPTTEPPANVGELEKAKAHGNGGDDEGLHLARFQSWGP